MVWVCKRLTICTIIINSICFIKSNINQIRINKQKICILECFTEKNKIKNHPFIAGRVSKKFSNGSIRIITNNGFIRITKIRVKNQIMNPTEVIKINDVLFTPRNVLDKSRMTTISVKNMK